MRDLYRRIGVSHLSDHTTIREASEYADLKLQKDVEHALLGTRRAAYDRNRELMHQIGKLRCNLGLRDSANWSEEMDQDFGIYASQSSRFEYLKKFLGERKVRGPKNIAKRILITLLLYLFMYLFMSYLLKNMMVDSL